MNTLTKDNLWIDNSCLGKEMLLVETAPYFEYVNKVRTNNILGYKYTVVLPQRGFEKLDVKIPGNKLLEVQAGQSIPMSFTALQVRPYISYNKAGRDSLQFTASAEGIAPKR